MQNCRGTWGSGGEFDSFRNEREDGLATFKRLEDQPWFTGSMGMFGLSYFGYTQLAQRCGLLTRKYFAMPRTPRLLFFPSSRNINKIVESEEYPMKRKQKFFRGCLLGGAIGDALGYAVEILRLPEITNKFGESGITDFVLSKDTNKVLVSDDTQMTLFTAGGMIWAYILESRQTYNMVGDSTPSLI